MKTISCCESSSWFSLRDCFYLYILAAAKLLLHFFININDQLFRDEFYYLANAAHLDWGYVDHPPFVGLIAAITTFTFGDSLMAVRFPVVIIGSASVYLSGIIAKEMGGCRFAQILAAVCTLISPVYLAFHSYYSMNAFDLFFWQMGFLCILILNKKNCLNCWIFFGIVMGLGLQNKLSMLFFGFGLFVGMLFTNHKRWFLNPYTYLCAAIAFIIFLPNILWQIAYEYPTLEFMYNASVYKNVNLSPVSFLKECILEMHPFSFPIWLAGLYWLFALKQGREYILFGWIFLTCLAVFNLTNGKPYYLAVAYSGIIPAGAVIVGNTIASLSRKWLQPVFVTILLLGGCFTVPIVLPILPAPAAVWYLDASGIQHAKIEKGDSAELPQILADRYGWKEMVATIAQVYESLSDEEQKKCAILASNYGQAGAIDYYGHLFNLPKAISVHNSYYHWGVRDYTGEIVIALAHEDDLRQYFDEVTLAATIVRPYSMLYENNRPIYICRFPKMPLSEIWKREKNFM